MFQNDGAQRRYLEICTRRQRLFLHYMQTDQCNRSQYVYTNSNLDEYFLISGRTTPLKYGIINKRKTEKESRSDRAEREPKMSCDDRARKDKRKTIKKEHKHGYSRFTFSPGLLFSFLSLSVAPFPLSRPLARNTRATATRRTSWLLIKSPIGGDVARPREVEETHRTPYCVLPFDSARRTLRVTLANPVTVDWLR